MLSIKIFDNEKHETINDKINYAIKNQIGVELCMYNELFLNEKEQELVRNVQNKSIHANHKYSIFTLATPNHKYHKNFYQEIKFAKQCGTNKMIIHIAGDTETGTFYTMPTLAKKEMFIRFFKFISELPKEYDNFTFCIENTFETPEFFRNFLNLSKEYLQPQKIGFCFDIGHAKVWSSTSIQTWKEFIESLHSESIPLHFHVHANDGTNDMHQTFHAHAQIKEYANYDDTNIMELILLWNKTFQSMFAMEVPSKECINEADFWLWTKNKQDT